MIDSIYIRDLINGVFHINYINLLLKINFLINLNTFLIFF